MRPLSAVVLGAGLVLLAAAEAPAQQRSYTYVPIGTFGTGPTVGSAVHDVNASGQLSGHAGTRGSARAIRVQDGRITNLGEINGSGQSIGWGINDAGDVVGQTHPTSDYEPSHLFLYRDGKMTDLGAVLGSGMSSFGRDINNAGWIVGDRVNVNGGATRGFVWRDGQFEDLGSLGGSDPIRFGTTTSAQDVNDRGQIVGASMPAKGAPLHAYIWENGTMRDLGVLGPDTEATQAFAINNHGQVVGSSQNPSLDIEGFIWEDGQMESLGSLGDGGSTPQDINDRGEVVGYSRTPESPYLNTGHAFLWADGTMHDLNDLVTNLPDNVLLETAEAINDDGIIVGETCDSYCDPGKTAREHGYMLVPQGLPVPTPKPTLLDTSSYARPVTVAGPAPIAAKGRWGDGLRFAGGRLETPQFEIPLIHAASAYIRPDDVGGEQMIFGQWKSGASPGDGAALTKLVYDGTSRRVIYSVVDANGQVISTATPPGSYGTPGERFRLVAAGIAKTGELVVAIDGTTYCNATKVTSIDRGDGATPITVGSAADGSLPFAGVIEGAGLHGAGISNTDYRLPWWEGSGSASLVYFFHDADQLPPDINDEDYTAPPSVPKTPCRVVGSTPAATPTPTPTATRRRRRPLPRRPRRPLPRRRHRRRRRPLSRRDPTPTPTPTSTPTPSLTPTATPSPTPSPSPTPTPASGPVWAPPAPAITAPSSYSWSRTATLMLSGTAQAGSTVEIFHGATSFGTATVAAAGTWARAVTVPADGAYLITAKARTLGGTSPSSGTRVIQVDTRAPEAPVITAPIASTGSTFTLTGTAEPGTTVEVFENGVSQGTAAASNGTWSRTFSGVPTGTRTFIAKATDFAGNTSVVSAGYYLRIG